MITDLFQFQFMQHAFIAGILIAIVAPCIGIFLVVRRYSLMADTLAHVSLAGVALGVLAGLNPIATAVLTSIAAALAIETLRTRRQISGESILSLFLSGGLAIAVILLSIATHRGGGISVDIVSFLFGSITTITTQDLWLIGIAGAGVLAALAYWFNEFFFISLNEELAAAKGLRTARINLALATLTAITVSISLRTVGILLIGALMVIPVLTALQFHQSFRRSISMAIACSLFSVITGLTISYLLNIPSGGAIVCSALLLFITSAIVNKGAHIR